MASSPSSLAAFWPTAREKFPSPYCLPFTMTGIGRLFTPTRIDMDHQHFKNQNWNAQLQIPIDVPVWVADHYGGLLEPLFNNSLVVEVFRYHAGPVQDLPDGHVLWCQVVLEPHFNYVPMQLQGSDGVEYKRLAWIRDGKLHLMSDPVSEALPPPFPSPALNEVCFGGFVDLHQFPLADNPDIGLDLVTRNSSAVFKTWSRFQATAKATLPRTGWYANHVYAMWPKCHAHLASKCAGYGSDSPFNRHGKKAFVKGTFLGFCNKKKVLAGNADNRLQFLPFVEITAIDWPQADRAGDQGPPQTPPTGMAKPRTGKFAFDLLGSDEASPAQVATPSVSGSAASQGTLGPCDPFSVDAPQDVTPLGGKRQLVLGDVDDDIDGPSPTKRSRLGGLRGRRDANAN